MLRTVVAATMLRTVVGAGMRLQTVVGGTMPRTVMGAMISGAQLERDPRKIGWVFVWPVETRDVRSSPENPPRPDRDAPRCEAHGSKGLVGFTPANVGHPKRWYV